jgi:ribosomal protein S18 acetylase RimI-like enzyme
VTRAESIRVATGADLERILPLMRGYYRDDGLEFNETRARGVMARLLGDARLGFVLIAEVEAQTVGYIVLCQSFSLEFGGLDGFLDELFVIREHRGRGIARRLIAAFEREAQLRGLVAVHLEVDRGNETAQRLYESRRYAKRDRYFVMTRELNDDEFIGEPAR